MSINDATEIQLFLAELINKFPVEDVSDKVSELKELIINSLQERIKGELAQYFRRRLDRTKALSISLQEILTDELESYIEHFLDDALEEWQRLVDGQASESYNLRYSGSDYINSKGRTTKKYKDLFLALDAYQDDDTSNLWSVPMSLRTVESEAVINIKDK